MRYIRGTVRAIVSMYLLLFVVLVSVFAIERLAYIVNILLEYKIDLSTIAILYASLLPDVADMVLPIAVVIATYTIVLRRREAREFLVLSSAGIGLTPIMVIAFVSAGLAAAICLALSGWIKPAASHAFRVNYAHAFAGALSKGISGGKFYRQDDMVMYVSEPKPDGNTQMRVLSFDGERLHRLTISDCAALFAIDERIFANLCAARIYQFGASRPEKADAGQASPAAAGKPCRFCASASGKLEITRVEGGRSVFAFDMNTLLDQASEPYAKDRPIWSLLQTRDGAFQSVSDARLAGSYIMTALACFVAVGAGLGAVAATARRTGPAALGVAVGAVIAAIGLAQSDLVFSGPIGQPIMFYATVAMAILVAFAAIVFPVRLLHRELVTPMFLQS